MKSFPVWMGAVAIAILTAAPGFSDTSEMINLGKKEWAHIAYCETREQAEKVARSYSEEGFAASQKAFKENGCTVVETMANAMQIVSSWKGKTTMRVVATEIVSDDYTVKTVYAITLLPIKGIKEV